MAMQALLLARDDDSRAWLQGCLGDDITILPGDARTAEDSVAEIANTPDVGLVFVQFDGKGAAVQGAMVEAIVAAYPELPVVAVGREDGGETVLAPGGYHVMITGLPSGPAEGDRIDATLTFETAGDVDVTFNVEPRPRSGAEGHGHAGH